MKKTTLLIVAAGVLLTSGGVAADQTAKERRAERKERIETKADVDHRIQEMNRLDNDASARLGGLRAVSHETGIPVPQLEAQLKAHPKTGIAGLLVANQIALESKKDVNQILREHSAGTVWAKLGPKYGVSLDTMDAKLTAVENAMKAAK